MESKMKKLFSKIVHLVYLAALVALPLWVSATPKPPQVDLGNTLQAEEQVAQSTDESTSKDGKYAIATFAGGCFWCMEPPFDKLPGVIETISGYTGGHVKNPSYKEVTQGSTGHYEALQVTYDPAIVNYKTLLLTFWRNIDPLDDKGQFCDKGPQYKSAIFFHNKDQLEQAQQSLITMAENKKFSRAIATQIKPAKPFYPAEEYHQNYYQKNPVRYKYYRWGCKRDKRLKELWGDSEND